MGFGVKKLRWWFIIPVNQPQPLWRHILGRIQN